jgi:hypothetical protein
MRDTKNTVEESSTIIPIEEKKETLQLQKNQPVETDKKVRTIIVRLRNNSVFAITAWLS